MRPALLYHDVVTDGRFDATGFPGADAGSYKLDAARFAEHLDALAATGGRGVSLFDALRGRADRRDFLLTFDDGGSSALDAIAPLLARRGWRGHFFVTTDRIGTAGFVDAAAIRELIRLGHVVGTHSCSHPAMMSRLSRSAVDREWRESLAALRAIAGEPVIAGSVPGGFLSRCVAESAAAAGIRVLFTSEPTSTVRRVRGCTLVGRYLVRRATPPSAAAALASGDATARRLQWLAWNAKKPLKALGGGSWLRLRERVFALRAHRST